MPLSFLSSTITSITSATIVLVRSGVSRATTISNHLAHSSRKAVASPFPITLLLFLRSSPTRHCLDRDRRDSGWSLGGILALSLGCGSYIVDETDQAPLLS